MTWDFYWDRESGLRVNIGVLNVHLIPEYRDVAHDGDNKYMLSNDNVGEDKTKFRQIVRNYCRSDASSDTSAVQLQYDIWLLDNARMPPATLRA